MKHDEWCHLVSASLPTIFCSPAGTFSLETSYHSFCWLCNLRVFHQSLLIVHSTLCLCQFVEEETPKIVISIRHHKKLKIVAGGTKHHHQQWQQQRPPSKGHMAFTWAAILGPYGSFGSKGCSGCSPAFHALWQVQGKICQELGFPHLSVKAGWVFCAN